MQPQSNGTSILTDLCSWFDDIKVVRSPNAHTISPLIEQEWIDVEAVCNEPGIPKEEQELELLVRTI